MTLFLDDNYIYIILYLRLSMDEPKNIGCSHELCVKELQEICWSELGGPRPRQAQAQGPYETHTRHTQSHHHTTSGGRRDLR